MQASGSLSVVQRHSLESAHACFKGVTAFLESIENGLESEDKFTAVGLRALAEVCEKNLLEAFPELRVWAGR